MSVHRSVIAWTALVCGAAFAQPPVDPTAPAAPPPAAPAGTQPAAPAAEDAQAKRERLLRAAKLPKQAHEVRSKGVPDADMKEALKAAKRKGLKADEMSDVTDEQNRAMDEHGPVDNFGAFVQSKLDEGLRGRDLAAAIKAEHVKRGKGKGALKKPGRGGPDRGKGKPEEKPGKDDTRDKPGKPDGKGKDDAGKGKGKEKGGGR